MANGEWFVSIEYIRVNQIDGIELVEIEEDGIEYLLVNKIHEEIDDEKPVQIHGTVVVSGAFYANQIVYDRSPNNPESKGPGEYLTLTGPSMPVWAYDPFLITVCLWFHGDDEIVSGEIEGEIHWEMRMPEWQPPLDQLVQKEISGKWGCVNEISGKYSSVTVGYSVISNAVSATIDVVMINGDGESPVAIYGVIKAASTFLDGSLPTRMLFDKSANEYVEVSPQQSIIPLTRPVFTVPVDSSLTIVVDLWDHDGFSADDQIALGSLQFAMILGTQKKTITGKYGQVQVSITL